MFLRFLHRLLEIFLHVERRFEQPFLRPAFDAVFRMPIALFVTAIQNSMRSREDIGLAEETLQIGEDEDVQTMIDEMRRHLVRDFPRGGFERAGNTKTHGLVRGELVIHDGLPDKLRKGLFADACDLSLLGALLRAGPAYRAGHQRRRLRQHQRQGHGRAGREAVGRREAHAGLHRRLHADLRHRRT